MRARCQGGDLDLGAAAWPAQKTFLEEVHTLIILCGASRAGSVRVLLVGE